MCTDGAWMWVWKSLSVLTWPDEEGLWLSSPSLCYLQWPLERPRVGVCVFMKRASWPRLCPIEESLRLRKGRGDGGRISRERSSIMLRFVLKNVNQKKKHERTNSHRRPVSKSKIHYDTNSRERRAYSSWRIHEFLIEKRLNRNGHFVSLASRALCSG